MHRDPFRKLISDLTELDLTVDQYLVMVGSYEHAIAYSTLFWPTFREFEDCVFREEMDASTYQKWLTYYEGDMGLVEDTINHVHIVDVFPNVNASPSKAQVVYLGSAIRAMWACKLRLDFPQRRFCVEFRQTATPDLSEYIVTVFQER